ncbi:unnamed protein product [Orchesella dallaii]|uniref:Uncharacterized protein n=1 Tax=Orchesella dallaii TaxID=48710 RepID=A0ABP1PPB9_9HEXA
MRTVLVLFFLAVGAANSAILDSKQKTDWDDEDSMILPPSKPSSLPSKDADKDDKRTPIISIIPLEKDNAEETTEDVLKTLNESSSVSQSKEPTSQEQQDNSSAGSVEDNTSTEPKAAVVELRRVPLTFEIISLLQPDTENKAGQKPTGFFPGQSGETLYKSKLLGHMGEHEQQGSSEETSTPTTTAEDKGDSGDQSIPPMPLSYMIPPRQDAEVFWREYPHDSTTENSGSIDKEDYGYSSSVSTDSEAPMLTTEAPFIRIDPIWETLSSLQKAKRQSIEESESDGGEQVEMTTVGTPDIPESTPLQETETTSPSIENESLYQEITPPSPINEEFAWNNQNQAILPTPGQPETIDYQPEAQPLPFRRNSPSLMDQYYSDYRPQPNQFPSMPMMSPEPVMYPSQKPRRPLYIQSDSYWPQKYFDGYGDRNLNNIDYPFIRYNDNYRPRSNMIPPLSPLLNTIQDERPIRVGGYDDDDEFAFGNYHNPNHYSYSYLPTPTPYVMNRRSNIRYQPYYPSPAPVMDDRSMYAPLYPYQFRRVHRQPQYYY